VQTPGSQRQMPWKVRFSLQAVVTKRSGLSVIRRTWCNSRLARSQPISALQNRHRF